ncbi:MULTISPECIES: hypothetical protein [Microbacterium]|uniref:hypothetical protein n=1 Tax=Microbacterium TaxID=33882 RepID=UPI002780CFF2|nr:MULTISPECIES: hypothetical protein [Microbacterium]MDQ1083766.1 ABC-type antimicrobial peptide transport system permease subunit [Microbacterium sp. SORGH_AS_0344]MDQ1170956.1 ABC-type antimicrobial peptide transport system permease subunit [Microbacterium proteolyticum]
MTQTKQGRSFASRVAFFVVFTALFLGGMMFTLFAAPLFGLTPLQWGIALSISVVMGLFAAWELRCLLVARKHNANSRLPVG